MKRHFFLLSSLLCFGLALPVASHAATYTVTKTSDTTDGTCGDDCSLREAVIAANATTEEDTIVLDAETYTLSIPGTGENQAAKGDLDITQPVTIQGTSAQDTMIDANEIDRVFHVTNSDATLTLEDVTVTNGSVSQNGGAISSAGTTTLDHVVLTGNVANSEGAAIYNDNSSGTFTIENSTLSSNTGSHVIYHSAGNMIVDNSTISDNAFGIENAAGSSGTLSLVYTTLVHSGTALRANSNSVTSVWASIIGGSCNINNNATLTSAGYNVSDHSNCDLTATTDLSGVDLHLADLADNGGSTPTRALLETSPARDTLPASACVDISIDQRGAARPKNTNCDSGAFEYYVDDEAPTITFTGNDVITWKLGVPFVDPGFTVTDNEDADLTAAVVVDNSVDALTRGTYTISYRVEDHAGNVTTQYRTVYVMKKPGIKSLEALNNSRVRLIKRNDITLTIEHLFDSAGTPLVGRPKYTNTVRFAALSPSGKRVRWFNGNTGALVQGRRIHNKTQDWTQLAVFNTYKDTDAELLVLTGRGDRVHLTSLSANSKHLRVRSAISFTASGTITMERSKRQLTIRANGVTIATYEIQRNGTLITL